MKNKIEILLKFLVLGGFFEFGLSELRNYNKKISSLIILTSKQLWVKMMNKNVDLWYKMIPIGSVVFEKSMKTLD